MNACVTRIERQEVYARAWWVHRVHLGCIGTAFPQRRDVERSTKHSEVYSYLTTYVPQLENVREGRQGSSARTHKIMPSCSRETGD